MRSLSKLCVAVSLSLSSGILLADDNPADLYSSMKFRSMGPGVTGGRVSDLAVNPNNPAQYFVATAAGGLWKTDNAGTTWTTPFDGQGTSSLGDVTLDPNNPLIVWVGSGENNSQRSVGYGDGVYKSVDGGNTWKNVGLKSSEHIGKILVDPRDSDTVFVASQGPLWSDGGDRGVFKTTDGGKTWENVLSISDKTGVNEIVFDPRNPDVIYASAYQRRRHVFTLINGGPESAIYKSVDGGKTWDKINKGLPSVDMGRIGLAIAPTRPDTVYAIVEAADGKSGFYRTTNGGASWHKQSSYVSGSPQYYQEIVVDPVNPERVYSLDTYLMVSEDGGKNFKRAGEKDKHVDNHALWIDPNNTDHLIVGCDGGIYETWDRAKNWHFKSNTSLTQFYRVTVDNDLPFYNVFGGTQDNASLGAPHQTQSSSGILNSDWLYTQYGDGFETAIDPEDPNIIYSQYQYGGLARYDKRSGERVQMQPVSPNADEAQRWNWNSPLLISPHNNKRLYYASQRLFRSDDRGDSWKAISPDLSQNLDRNKLEVMGRVWGVDTVSKNRSTSLYGAIISLTESTIQEGLIYTGSDDGVMHVTKNAGTSWDKMSWPKGVPSMTYVSDLEASLFEKNTVFATFDNHKRGDFKPYVFVSDNNGRSWKNISGDLPEKGTVYTVIQDHVNKDLLFAGTEFGVFFTQNRGKNWTQLKSGIPTVAVRDLDIQRRENDLAVASFGRGFYILDDYTPLRQDAAKVKEQDAFIYPVSKAQQFTYHDPLGTSGKASQGASLFMAKNPEFGARFTYYVGEEFKSIKAKRQANEKELRKDNKDVMYPSWAELKEEDFEQDSSLFLTVKDQQGNLVRRMKQSASKGLHHVYWDLRYPGFDNISTSGKNDGGPFVVPGKYTVSLSRVVNGVETQYGAKQTFEVESLNNGTFLSSDRNADHEFDMKAGQLNKAISGAASYLSELNKRLDYVESGITATNSVDQTMLKQVHDLRRDYKEIDLLLNGNSVVSRRSEATPDSVRSYIGYLLWSRSESLSPVSGLQKLRFERASEGYAKVYPRMVALSKQIEGMEKTLRDNGSGWIPGTLPLRGAQ